MILVRFHDPDALHEAARRLAAAGADGVETYGPTPSDLPGYSVVPVVMLGLGVVVAVGAFAMQAYATTYGYRLDIGGRPDLFWPSYLPFAIEAGMLAAMVAGLVGFLVAARMPDLYETVDEAAGFGSVSRDGWFLSLRGALPAAGPEILADADAVEELPE